MMRSLVIILVFVSFSKEQQSRKVSGKIIGGIEVDIKDYPYQISMLYSNIHICGGSIISPDWILTAAHCIQNTSTEQYSVRVGSTYRLTGGDLHSVSKIVIHEEYSKSTFDYDIALFLLDRSITAENTQVIQLPSPGTGPDSGTTIVVTGWGITEQDRPSDVLKMVQLSVVNHKDCKGIYSDRYRFTDNMFCAGERTGSHGVCYTDSGGPAVVEGIQYGIASWSLGCAIRYYPAVFANVASLRNWIDESCAVST